MSKVKIYLLEFKKFLYGQTPLAFVVKKIPKSPKHLKFRHLLLGVFRGYPPEYLVLFISILFLSNCSPKKERPIIGGELKIAWTGGLVGLDPNKDWGCAGAMKLISIVFSPLYNVDNQDLGIASRCEHSSDYKEWIFFLRKNCYFHNDPCFLLNPRIVNAYDVKFTFDEIKRIWGNLDPNNNITEIAVIDSFRVKIILKNSDPDFLNKINQTYLSIVPYEAVEKYRSNFSFHPVGSGPFCFESWDKNQLVLKKNKNYWAKDKYGQKLPYLERIVVLFLSDVNECVSALLSGDVDISPVSADVAEMVFTQNGDGLKDEYAKKFQLIQCPFPSLTVLLTNSRDNPIYKSADLRKALNYAVNREKLKDLLFIPKTTLASGPTLRNVSGIKFDYDLGRARKLLTKAGYTKNLNNLIFQYYPSPFSKMFAECLQKQLNAIGIKTRLRCASRIAVLRGHPEWDFGLVSILYNDSTSASQLSPYYSGNAPWVDFYSEEFDSLWKLYETKNISDDSNLIAQMESLVIENPPYVFLYWTYPSYLASKGLKGIDPLLLLSPYIWWKNE